MNCLKTKNLNSNIKEHGMDLNVLEAFVARLETLMAKKPDLVKSELTSESNGWMAEIHALVKESGEIEEAQDLKKAMNILGSLTGRNQEKARATYAGNFHASSHIALANIKVKILAIQNMTPPPMGGMG